MDNNEEKVLEVNIQEENNNQMADAINNAVNTADKHLTLAREDKKAFDKTPLGRIWKGLKTVATVATTVTAVATATVAVKKTVDVFKGLR